MKKCRYIPESDLSKTATDEEIDSILAALEERRFKIYGKAQSYVVGPWKMTTAAFVEAVQAHLENGNRIFHKPVQAPPPDTLFFSANVSLDPDTDDEDEDVYVEIRLKNGTLVILCDAHNHWDWEPRLPK
jgi:hypothetical protein